MEISYYCTKCEKEFCFNKKSINYEKDKISYVDDDNVLCNECCLGGDK